MSSSRGYFLKFKRLKSCMDFSCVSFCVLLEKRLLIARIGTALVAHKGYTLSLALALL